MPALLLIVLACIAASGCGQMGPLALPDGSAASEAPEPDAGNDDAEDER